MTRCFPQGVGVRHRHAFTLIELLIVVAIIAILAAIAVPNFLEAQVRAKVSRAASDLRTVATAMEAYRVDGNKYPSQRVDNGDLEAIFRLTTPIAYVTQIPTDGFQPSANGLIAQKATRPLIGPRPFYYEYALTQGGAPTGWPASGYSLRCMGPDRDWDLVNVAADLDNGTSTQVPNPPQNGFYDPTNGTVANGDVIRFGGGMAAIKK